jgi:tyrosine-protein phosphatase SIW14
MMRMRPFFSLLPLLLFLPLHLSAQTAADAAPPLAAASPAFGEKLHIAGIHNAGKISDVLYRGAQPNNQGLAELKKRGITTIVDLRAENHGRADRERAQAESLGMRFVHIPIGPWSSPTSEQVAEFLSLFRNHADEKVFVHCRFGDDRTGVFVAAYRMALEKWSPQQAMKEMYFFGFNGFWHPAMKSFIREFPSRLNSAPPLAPLREPSSSSP